VPRVARDRLQYHAPISPSRTASEVTVDGNRTYFDTNIGDHHHFYCEDDGTLMDIDGDAIAVAGCRPRRRARRSIGWT
jgi:hypothetical protein